MHGRPAAEPDRAGGQRGARALRRARSTPPPSRATCACRRRRRSASRSCSTTSRRRARRATSIWRASSWRARSRQGAAAASRPAGDGGHPMSAPKRKALGRGLAALIPGAPPPAAPRRPAPAGPSPPGARDGTADDRRSRRSTPRAGQPRKQFDDARLDELAASIRTQGIIQPLIVRARARAGGYELIAGERRWRAAQRAGLHEVPAVVRDVAPTQAFEMALVENLQREDLNPIEEAAGYQRLIDEFGYTQEQLAERVGKDRSTVANALRLLRLPEGVRGLVADGRLSMGHARALLGLEAAAAMERLARRVVAARAVGAPGRGAGAARARRTRRRRAAAPGAPVGDRARSRRAPDARARHAGQGRRGGPGARADRDPLPFARSARRAARASASLMSRAELERSTGAACAGSDRFGARVPIGGRVPRRVRDPPVQGRLFVDTTAAAADRHGGRRCSCARRTCQCRAARRPSHGCVRERPRPGQPAGMGIVIDTPPRSSARRSTGWRSASPASRCCSAPARRRRARSSAAICARCSRAGHRHRPRRGRAAARQHRSGGDRPRFVGARGHELIQTLRFDKRTSTAPIIALAQLERDRMRAHQLGFDEALANPPPSPNCRAR